MQSVLKEFALDEYILDVKNKITKAMSAALDTNTRFLILCDKVKAYMDQEWNKDYNRNNHETLQKRQKDAILGLAGEVNYFKDKIREFLKANNLMEEKYPLWYSNLIDAIFNELWGLAGIAPWLDNDESSSAKIVGDRIYFMINGRMKLQEQRISKKRYEQLRNNLLLTDPSKRGDDDHSEVYLSSGERVSIYTGDMVIKNQYSMVFRKYVIESLTFKEQASRGTIPEELIPFLESCVRIGVNVVFTGPVRSGKTTFLVTYQMLEDRELEGVFVQTDPEVKINDLMPNAPIMALIADGERLVTLTRDILRTDANYIVMGEARDGYAFNIMVEAANKGTRRMKCTMHLSNQEDFAYDVANKINSLFGGNLDYQIVKVAKSFNYIFEMVELPELRNQKRLMSITEIRYDDITHEITYHKICKYDKAADSWQFHYDVGSRVDMTGMFENPSALQVLHNSLKHLAHKYPMKDYRVIRPVYSKIAGENNV